MFQEVFPRAAGPGLLRPSGSGRDDVLKLAGEIVCTDASPWGGGSAVATQPKSLEVLPDLHCANEWQRSERFAASTVCKSTAAPLRELQPAVRPSSARLCGGLLQPSLPPDEGGRGTLRTTSSVTSVMARRLGTGHPSASFSVPVATRGKPVTLGTRTMCWGFRGPQIPRRPSVP